MNTSTVFFTSMRTKMGESLLTKMDRLMEKAGIALSKESALSKEGAPSNESKIDFNRKYVAIKIHFGEPGNVAFLRPNFAKVVVDRIKSLGGLPFLTDSNTLYVGRRNQGLNHLDAANENGYFPMSTGCQNIIADGIRGTDDVEVPVPQGEFVHTAFIGRAIMDADILISLNHFKGHEGAGFGGAIKNVGMGSASRAGKMAIHSDGKPIVEKESCIGCKICARFCAHNAIVFNNGKVSIDTDKCAGCGRCIGACSKNAIMNDWSSSARSMTCKIVEYTAAVLYGRPHFHINVVNQVSPYCDCHNESDAAVVPDIGIFASFDPVAVDKACIDAVNAAPGIMTSILAEREHSHRDSNGNADHFTDIHPTTDWRSQISHSEKIGLGSGTYKLVTVE